MIQIPEDLATHFESIGVKTGVPRLPRLNGGLPISPEGLVTADHVAALRRFYASDFATFGFPDLDAPAGPAIKAETLVNAYTDAIFDRNRVIAAHSLGAAPPRGLAPSA